MLARFKSLRYLTFMAGGVPSGSEDEATIATRWAAACPTLRTIILPQGNVWFEKDSTWVCASFRSVTRTVQKLRRVQITVG